MEAWDDDALKQKRKVGYELNFYQHAHNFRVICFKGTPLDVIPSVHQ